MHIVQIDTKRPEDHTPRQLTDDCPQRALGEHVFHQFSPSENVGHMQVRLTERSTITHKQTTPSGIIEGCDTPGWVTINIPTQSSGLLLPSFADHLDQRLSVTIGGEEVTLYMAENTEFYTLAIEESLLHHNIANGVFDENLLSKSASFHFAPVQASELIASIQTLLTHPSDAGEIEEMAAQLAVETLSSISDSEMSTKNRWRCVRKATQLVMDKGGKNLSIVDMTNVCHCSARTLNYAFKHVLGIGPKQFLERYRLNQLRRAILSEPDRPIHEIASQFDYFHGGNLAQKYRQLFNELPNQTQASAAQTKL